MRRVQVFRLLVVLVGITPLYRLYSFFGSVQPANELLSKETEASRFFRIQWNAYRTEDGLVQVVSAAQDHRHFPPSFQLSPMDQLFAFHDFLPTEKKSIFQFHLAVRRSLLQSTTNSTVWVEFWTHPKQSSNEEGTKLVANKCFIHQPMGFSYRQRLGTEWMDVIVRCAFTDMPECISCSGSTPPQQSCKAAQFAITFAGQTVSFPAKEVLHFPTLEKPLLSFNTTPSSNNLLRNHGHHNSEDNNRESESDVSNPFNDNHPAQQNILQTTEMKTENEKEKWEDKTTEEGITEGEKVCAFVGKKFTWTQDDEIWLQWMTTMVGVDRVMINVYAHPNEHLPSVAAIRERLGRLYPALRERVHLVETQVPGSPETYQHMHQAMNMDAFLRWQPYCDYAFSLDTDEFVELYDVRPPHPRINVKQFISQHREELTKEANVLYLPRLHLARESQPWEQEALLSKFLSTYAQFSGKQTVTRLQPVQKDRLGKSLFRVGGSLRPYLHFNEPKPPALVEKQVAHVLHIRVAEDDKPRKRRPTLRQLLLA
ncbi:hypothetical protein QOT17_022651 [Balamuthia mandrillaris]